MLRKAFWLIQDAFGRGIAIVCSYIALCNRAGHLKSPEIRGIYRIAEHQGYMASRLSKLSDPGNPSQVVGSAWVCLGSAWLR